VLEPPVLEPAVLEPPVLEPAVLEPPAVLELHALAASAATATNAPIEYRKGLLRRMGHYLPTLGRQAWRARPARQWVT
jgi:hypothetical protein